MPQAPLNVAIVGCGAMAEQQHLPCLVARSDCRVSTLVDLNRPRAEALAARFGVPEISNDYKSLLGSKVDAAVVVLPNYLHAPVSVDLLRAGIHVLVEKPMAPTVAECDAMLAAAGETVLAVGLMRRYSQACRFADWLIKSGLLGPVVSFDVQNGFAASNWPFASDYFLRKELAGGGALMDLGAHTLDQLLWWLGDIESFIYYDDNCGGVEADCRLELILKSGAQGVVEISRTRDLRETAIIQGERAKLEVSLYRNSISLNFLDAGMGMIGYTAIEGEPLRNDQRVAHMIAAEHEDFFRAIRTGQQVLASGTEARKSISLIEACYAQRRPLKLPWVHLNAMEGGV